MKRLVLTVSALFFCVTVLSITACSSGDGGSTAIPVAEPATEMAAPAGGSDAKTEAPAAGSGSAEPASGSGAK